jgi:hypothetical protein
LNVNNAIAMLQNHEESKGNKNVLFPFIHGYYGV